MCKMFRIGETVRQLMAENGVAKHKQVEYIRKELGMSQAQALRKLKDVSPWDIDQLEKICSSFDVTLSDFFSLVGEDESELAFSSVKIDNERLNCTLVLGKNHAKITSFFSALKINDNWSVIRTYDLDMYNAKIEDTREIKKISLHPYLNITTRKIAILDDDKDISKTLSDSVGNSISDCEVTEFHSISSILRNERKVTFDVYILDWVIGNNNSLEVIKYIREDLSSDALIIILTGKTGSKIDSDISTAIAAFDVLGPYEKPVRLDVLNTVIKRYLGG